MPYERAPGPGPVSLFSLQRARAYASELSGKRQTVDAAPAGVYMSVQVAAAAGGKEPLLELRIGDRIFCALLDTGSSVSLAGNAAIATAVAGGATVREEQHCLRLAAGWSQTTSSVRCRVHWAGGSRKQRFLYMPGLCRDIVLGRDFLNATGISIHISSSAWTIGSEQ